MNMAVISLQRRNTGLKPITAVAGSRTMKLAVTGLTFSARTARFSGCTGSVTAAPKVRRIKPQNARVYGTYCLWPIAARALRPPTSRATPVHLASYARPTQTSDAQEFLAEPRVLLFPATGYTCTEKKLLMPYCSWMDCALESGLGAAVMHFLDGWDDINLQQKQLRQAVSLDYSHSRKGRFACVRSSRPSIPPQIRVSSQVLAGDELKSVYRMRLNFKTMLLMLLTLMLQIIFSPKT
ncbi:hypothetical protein NDU88_002971 [Pleurodeles waltl]|uniref:Uncharacterized protein n=1 Tax=Pleurodeles waltl TaxID=8319 RepID=A0AAV7UEI2_PLEWA|nr:hypothetical protein NDU88_002971 [Pleurodeles waltl]